MKAKNLLKKAFLLLALVGGTTNVWADDVIFSMTSVTNGTTSVDAGGNLSITATYNTGSSAKVYNPTGGAKEMVSNTQINLKGSSSVYYVASFTTALQKGDVITSSNTAANTFYVAKNGGSKIAADFPYTIPESSPLIGETDLYVYKTGTSGTAATFTSFTITRPTGVLAPNISFSGTTVTLTCMTDGATIYYTTDGSVPTTESASKTSGQTFEISNSCTVRAYAVKAGVDDSAETTKDCYVNHSSADKFLAILKFNGGAVDGGDAYLWTSSDGKYSLRDNDNAQTSKYTSLETGNDAFKLSHVDDYTLSVPEDVIITKIAFIGKSLYEGYTGTVKVTGFNSNNAKSFIAYPADGINCLSTIEFTPDAPLTYGEAVAFIPGGCESAAYIELYGEERKGPADPVPCDFVFTETLTKNSSGVNVDVIDPDTYSSLVTITADTKSTAFGDYPKGWKISDQTSIVVSVPANVSNSSITIYADAAVTAFNLKTGDGDPVSTGTLTSVDWDAGSDATGKSMTISLPSSPSATTTYTLTKKTGNPNIYKVVYTYTAVSDDITLTTTANMAGWRAFYDASNGYTLDENTTAYVATAKNGNTVTMTSLVGGVPAGTPVILKTTSSADSYKMTLTKADVDEYGGTNLLSWTTSAVDSKYRLGYGAEGVGFYPYSGTPSSGAVILDISSSSSRALRLSFGSITGIDQIENGNIESSLPVKRIVNGKLVIEKKGHMFNAAGGILK